MLEETQTKICSMPVFPSIGFKIPSSHRHSRQHKVLQKASEQESCAATYTTSPGIHSYHVLAELVSSTSSRAEHSSAFSHLPLQENPVLKPQWHLMEKLLRYKAHRSVTLSIQDVGFSTR